MANYKESYAKNFGVKFSKQEVWIFCQNLIGYTYLLKTERKEISRLLSNGFVQ